ncbi:hypothetical protein Tco_1357011 [Tanacetum coccineum]
MDNCSSTMEFQYRPLQHLTRSKPFSYYIQRCDNIFYTRGVMSFGDMKEEVTVKRKDEIAYFEQGEGSLFTLTRRIEISRGSTLESYLCLLVV